LNLDNNHMDLLLVLVDMVLVELVLVDMVLVDMVLVDMVLVDMVLVELVEVEEQCIFLYSHFGLQFYKLFR
jgi:hypothetical protein